MTFESVYNRHEQSIFQRIVDTAEEYPGLAGNPELLADVACVALNRLQPHYIRHQVDMSFYTNDQDRTRQDDEVNAAVEFAFRFVLARGPQATG